MYVDIDVQFKRYEKIERQFLNKDERVILLMCVIDWSFRG